VKNNKRKYNVRQDQQDVPDKFFAFPEEKQKGIIQF
jgi:hypothetical protein